MQKLWINFRWTFWDVGMLIYDILAIIQSFLDIKRTVLVMQEFLAKIGFASLIHSLCAPLLFYKTTCLNIYDARLLTTMEWAITSKMVVFKSLRICTRIITTVVPSTGATLISKKIIAAIAARTLVAIRARAFVNFWKTFLVLTPSTLVWCLTWQNVVFAWELVHFSVHQTCGE